MSTSTQIKSSISISPRAAHQIERGSLWVFSNEIKVPMSQHQAGEWCWFVEGNRTVGTGYFNPHSLIAGRIVDRDRLTDVEALLRLRLKDAFLRRKDVLSRGSARLFFSEADFLPGLIIDWFSGTMVIQSNTAGVDSLLDELPQTAMSIFNEVFGTPVVRCVIRADSSIRKLENAESTVKAVLGEESEFRSSWFTEDKIFFKANLWDGQKTGFFLDQRENRVFLEQWVNRYKSQSVLDLFCYSGGWGFRALKGGSDRVTFVDQSEEAIALIKDGLDKNNFPSLQTQLIQADVFDYLEKEKGLYDVIVADPPAFVKSKKNLPQAIKAYEKLNRLAWRRLKPGGILLSSSCSYHLSESDFLETLRTAVSREGGQAHVVHRGYQGHDHPVLLSMPETLYLKCVGLQKIS